MRERCEIGRCAPSAHSFLLRGRTSFLVRWKVGDRGGSTQRNGHFGREQGCARPSQSCCTRWPDVNARAREAAAIGQHESGHGPQSVPAINFLVPFPDLMSTISDHRRHEAHLLGDPKVVTPSSISLDVRPDAARCNRENDRVDPPAQKETCHAHAHRDRSGSHD